ncbi:MAG: helix-turn-helix domain-containing protein, partial [Rhodospirillaceae bacterium]|nr:helix-turn-helix domain-containing protein [Rhodospirillaceae bacterium]
HRLRCYPTAVKRRRLEGDFGAARWLYNRALEYRTKACRRRGEPVTGVDSSRLLTRLKCTLRCGWLNDTRQRC